MTETADAGSLTGTTFTSVSRLTNFTSNTLYVDKDDIQDVVTSITIVPLYDDPEPDIVLTPLVTDGGLGGDNGQVTISGRYSNTFKDKFYYVSKNSSDKLEELQVAIGYNNLPVDHTLIRLEQDETSSYTRQYRVSWRLTTDAGSINVAGSQVVTQIVTPDNYDAIKTLIGNYYET